MKEKYIFFTLLILALVMLIGARSGKKSKQEIGAREKVLQKRLKKAERNTVVSAGEIDMDKVQGLVGFSEYEGLLTRSPFIQVQPKKAVTPARAEPIFVPVEEQTPRFMYKGKIGLGARHVVIIEEVRTGETFMVSKDESIGGYKVLDITDSEVILSKKGEQGEEKIVLKTREISKF